MKNRYSTFILLAAFITLLTACSPMEFDVIPVEQIPESQRWTANHAFSELISKYTTTLGIHPDSTRKNSGATGIYSVDSIPRFGAPIVISGRVISSDIEGNIYKSLTIQEAVTGMGLKISVNVSGSEALYPVGQLMNIMCNGLFIGKYADMYQLGTEYYNVAQTRLDNVTIDPLKTGYEIGRIPYPVFRHKVQLIGLPEPSKILMDTVTIQQIKASSDRKYHSRLVVIKNAYFTGLDGDGKVISDAKSLIFAPPTMGFGYPQARQIKDATGTLSVSTSEYAKFATQPIPSSKYVGNIVALVGWYKDKATQAGSWQLTLRSLGDLSTGFEGYLNEIHYKPN